MRSRIIVLGACFLVLASCESIIGSDFGAYGDACEPMTNNCPQVDGGLPDGGVAYYACHFDNGARRFRCVPDEATAPVLGRCNSDFECPAGAGCGSLVNSRNADRCAFYCAVNSDCAFGASCVMFSNPRLTKPGRPIGLCGPMKPLCEPLEMPSKTCPNDSKCFVVDDEYSACVPLYEPVAVGAACNTTENCPQGSGCFGDRCKPYCAVASPSCPGQSNCKAISGAPRINKVEIGFCD